MANIEASSQNISPPIPAVTGNAIYPAVLVPELEEVIARPDRTSPLGLEQYIAGRTLVSGDSPAWNDMFVQVYSRLNKQEPFLVPAVAEPLIVWVMSGEAVVEERDLDRDWVANTVTVGDFFLTRSPTPYEMRWRAIGDAPFQVMHLYLSVPLFERVAYDMLGCAAPPALRDISGGKDTQLSHILAVIHQELTSEGKGSQLFIQGLAQTLVVHLIRNYAASEAPDDRQNALPGFKLRRAVAHLEEHLAEPFNLAQLAETVGMSEFHFSRLFKKATGLSPSRYFIRQRVARAQLLLQETDTSIIEIGMSVGYSSPSHFAQVFRRETGLPPSRYRRG
ncbi:helix-turn-helix domain-containing protein [Rhizobium leguminosarum]|uniref:helix-turn-helix domain-containing protein n=1 Tax=Rhizobium leguminosarum TaxID=384 RepID=UPI001C951EB7|nr:AraC family transcriptional regulator [Rhizobium leguminosarum]MBY5796272.1 helix-turn-helix transcriptional regulator [Rhizobium leguminosarum]